MDYLSLPIEADNKNIDGQFRLVNIITQRAKDLARGAKPKIDTKAKKVSMIAIEEVMSGKIEFITGEEALLANEEARKLDYKKFLEEKRRKAEPEDLSELEKDVMTFLDERDDKSKKSHEDIFTEGENGA